MRRNGLQSVCVLAQALRHQRKQNEAPMRSSNQIIRPDPTGIWAHPGNLLTLTLVMVIVALLPLLIHPRPAFSQGVNLVKVDVSVVGKGLRASKLAGHSVVNEKNETVGKIDDIIVGDDRSLYVVLEVGGFLGIGSRLVAVPYDSLKIDQDAGKVQKVELPGASHDELKRLAEFKYPA
jgi:sporulation protein YlmC with PRC-barrel domain